MTNIARTEVHVTDEWHARAVSIVIAQVEAGPTGAVVHVLRSGHDGESMWQREDDPAVVPAPSLWIPREVARKLYLELGRIVGADAPHEHEHAREDLLHERSRVDRLLGALIETTGE